MLQSQARWTKGSMPWQRTPNRVLAKSQLGRTRPITIDLPQDRHYYGKQTPQDQYNAREVVYDSQEHNPSDPHDPPAKDLIKANKSCITNKLHTSKDFYKFRQTNDSIIPTKTYGSKGFKLNLPQQGFTYGKQNEGNDAIRTLLGNGFGLSQSQRIEKVYNTRQMFKSMQPKKLSAHMTKSYYLMKNSAQRKLQTLSWKKAPEKTFKLSKYNNAVHKVDDYRRRPRTSGGFSESYHPKNQQGQQNQERQIEQSK